MTDTTIGSRARMIRRRRGLSLDVAAGLAGISKSYLSMLETGRRRFDAVAGQNLGTLVTELQVAAVSGTTDDRRAALAALVQACHVAEAMGHQDLALAAATREHEAAARLATRCCSGWPATDGRRRGRRWVRAVAPRQ